MTGSVIPDDLVEVRRKAWETRRAKYGPRGHAGSYSRASHRGLLALVIELHTEGVLSEGQVAKASGLDRVTIRHMADDSKAARQALSPDIATVSGRER